MTHIAPLVTVILTSSLLTWTAAEEASILCTWTKVLPTGDVHYSFLRGGSPSLRLYHSVWSGERALRSCTWTDDAAVTQSYLSLCRERTQGFSDHPDVNIDVKSMFEANGLCVSMGSPVVGGSGERAGKRPVRSIDGQLREGQAERSEVRAHQRVKRSFIVPGTLWCGAGNKAPSYEDLGVFAETDKCCRAHDHCKHTILSFRSNFGVFNSNLFTLSQCTCDNKFRRCLRKATDVISEAVGYTFFNLLKMQCFDLIPHRECTQTNWFGTCKNSKTTLKAEILPPRLWVSSNKTTSRTSGAESRDTIRTDITEPSCAAYKDLDECENKILPRQEKYGLHNPDATTLYHCNCTTRLFQTLAKQRHQTKVQALLLGHVSQSCFLPQECSAGTNCTAVLVKAELPQLDQRSGADMEEQRHLQAVRLKVRRPNTRRAKRRDRVVRLYKLCLRMVRPKPSKDRQL